MPNARIRPPLDAWANILPGELEALEVNLAASINGDDGSTHAPSTPITIVGLGGVTVTGPSLITRGGVVTTGGTLVNPTVTCADGDYPELDEANPFRSEPRYVACAEAIGAADHTWCVRRENGGLQAFSPMYDLRDGAGMRVARAYVQLRAHNASTLTSVTVFFHVGWPHLALPSIMPSARVLRIDAQGNYVAMTSPAAGADANGYVYVPRPTTPGAWENNFAQQALTVPCDAANVIDDSRYTYIVELVEEQGLAGYPWQLNYLLYNILAATTGISLTLSGLQTVDGVPLGPGDFVLVKDQVDPNLNGIYQAASGVWARVAYGFSQGFVVPVLAGTVNGGTWWQASSLITTWDPNVIGTTTSPNPIVFVPKTDAALPSEGSAFFAHGLLWQAVVADYEDIADLRPR